MSLAHRAIYVISDLHLGGESESGKRGFRICTHEAELVAFLDSLTQSDGPAVELVINGDMVDFLAERTVDKPPRWLAFQYPEQNAIDILDRVVERCADVFNALRRFLCKGHRLVILPGNHDIELNLPAVRRRLREHVGGNGAKDYEFVSHGEAYRVGDVLIEHGNRVDDMNFVDYQALRHLCGLLSREVAVRDEFLFDPPAGSKLVAEVINDIKTTYSFIDLLKPEAEAAFPVILALEPGRRRQLINVASAFLKGTNRRREQLRQYNSNISARVDVPSDPEAMTAPLDTMQMPLTALDQILIRTVHRADFPTVAVDSTAGKTVQEISAYDKVLGLAHLLFADRNETWEYRLHDLLDALRAFQSPSSFDRSVETADAYIEEARYLAYRRVRHVVFGHTHLAKQVPIPSGGFYLNSGTWADLLELPRSILDPTRTFGPLAELEQLVRDLVANDFSRYVVFRPTYVRIHQDSEGQSVAVELCDGPAEQRK